MSLPRQVLPGSFYKITRRTTQRQFWLRPDTSTNNTYVYCLLIAAIRYGIEIITSTAMSNHHHTEIFDRHGKVNEFVEHFHKLFAKAQNLHRGRRENLWSSEPPSTVRYEDTSRVLDGIVYTATNPVKDGLVARVRHWPGVNLLFALLERRTLKATRPRYFRDDGPMPETVELELVIPPELGDPDDVRRELRKRVAAAEERFAKGRALSGQRVLGRSAVLRQSPQAAPKSVEPRGARQPRHAARDLLRQLDAFARERAFLDAYRRARLSWIAGFDAMFPFGTYWLRRFAGVPVAPATVACTTIPPAPS